MGCPGAKDELTPMFVFQNLRARQARVRNRLAARLSGFARPAQGLVWQPEPRSIGHLPRGHQLMAGNLQFAGHLVEAPDVVIWSAPAPDDAFVEEIHGFAWLDDLAAVGDGPARALAQRWLWDWIARYGRGQGPGWTPELAGRRVIRWLHHALFLLRGTDAVQARAFHRALAAQARFLARRAHAADPGLPRFEALTGLLYAAVSLEGLEALAEPGRRALAAECGRQIDEDGAIVTRNPEELLQVFTLLTWADEALTRAGAPSETAVGRAIERIAPTLRALRHADGALARFHGGGAGAEGALDSALAQSGVRRRAPKTRAMGFVRLTGGRSTVIVDAAPPPAGRASAEGHASMMAFELTSGRRPVIVNCGTGRGFGADWRRAGRATSAHSTLCLAGVSSVPLAPPRQVAGAMREYLARAPEQVPVQLKPSPEGLLFEGGHNGYLPRTGLTHARSLRLSPDGAMLSGEDYLVTLDTAGQKTFDKAVAAGSLTGMPFSIHFHLHPDVEVEIDMGGTAVSLTLPSGEVWVLRHETGVQVEIEPSVYFAKGRLRPRESKQVVFSGRTIEYATRVRWSLAKAQDSAMGLRDLADAETDASY